MRTPIQFSVYQAHAVWIVSIVNIGLGFFIPGFDVLGKSISHVALEAPAFAYTHRVADVVIGASMCLFALGINGISGKKTSFSMLTIGLLGLSMVSAGIWTLESPLHLLYNLSIFMILSPVVFALEFRERLKSPGFETFCLGLGFLHVSMFWAIYAGFIPSEYNGLVQRIWAVPTMGWFGVAVWALQKQSHPNEEGKPWAATG